MLTIHRPEIVEHEDTTVLQARFECEDVTDTLWFSTSKEFGGYLCHERGDAFLVAMLLYAMKRGEDIRVLAPISERLYYGLTKHLISVIADIFPGYRPIKIICDIDAGHLESVGGVATGFSCGIDSFYTVIEHTNESCPPDYRLTHLAFFNVGAGWDYGGNISRSLYHKQIKEIQPCTDELHLPLVTLDSNLSEILYMDFEATHTYRNAAAVLALQKIFKVYYFSSGKPITLFKLTAHDTGSYEIYLSKMLSSNDTEFFSVGECTRLEKTIIVSDYPLSHRYLSVCTEKERNCGRCPKCQRTQVTLDLLGKLDLYNAVFNLDDYRKNRSKFLGLVLSGRRHDVYKNDIYKAMKSNGTPFPLGAYVYRFILPLRHFAVTHCPKPIRRWYKNLKKRWSRPSPLEMSEPSRGNLS